MKYQTHVYALFRLPLEVEADNPQQAATLAADEAIRQFNIGIPAGLDYSDEIVDVGVDYETEHGTSMWVYPAWIL